jgi:hypothetical protein
LLPCLAPGLPVLGSTLLADWPLLLSLPALPPVRSLLSLGLLLLLPPLPLLLLPSLPLLLFLVLLLIRADRSSDSVKQEQSSCAGKSGSAR